MIIKKRHVIIFFSLVALNLLSWALVTNARDIRATPITAWTEDHRADCAIVLTGGPNRIRDGFDLLSQKMIKRLIISGVNPDVKLDEIFPQMAFYPEVDQRQIVLEKSSLTTFGNAQQSLPLVEALQCRDVILITSYIHMRRALRTFQAAFPDQLHILARSTVGKGYPPDRYDLTVEAAKSLFYSTWAYRKISETAAQL